MTLALERLPPTTSRRKRRSSPPSWSTPRPSTTSRPSSKAADFFREKNGWIYDACLALWERDEAINQITVAHELARRDRLEDVGGQTYLADVIRRLPTRIGAEYYARIVKRDAPTAA